MSHTARGSRQQSALDFSETNSLSDVPAGKQLSKAARFAADNRLSAALILADPERSGGDLSLPVIWARRIESAGSE